MLSDASCFLTNVVGHSLEEQIAWPTAVCNVISEPPPFSGENVILLPNLL